MHFEHTWDDGTVKGTWEFDVTAGDMAIDLKFRRLEPPGMKRHAVWVYDTPRPSRTEAETQQYVINTFPTRYPDLQK